ncbi:MAG TPA: TRAP transporter substrate-binding protein [Bacteroidales bacterium]|nr:TRAP transporter substrate-binding protein [Bacteroidales bacterium]
MSKKLRVSVYLLVTGLIISTSGCKLDDGTKTLKLAHGLDPSHPVSQAMEFFADRCEEISDGKLTVETYPSGQLGSEQQCVELLQIGSLAITKVSSAVLESFTEEFKVLGTPYLFKSKQHSFDVLDGPIGDEILLSTEPFWIRGLCFYDAGARSFYTIDTPIETPDDLDGLKIRVMKSITSMEMVQALGGSPTPISWGELYTALQSGVVDGAENNPPSFYTSHHYEVCKHYSLNEHTMVPDVLIISKNIYDDLTEQERKWLQQAIDESVVKQRELWAASERESIEKVKEAGVTVTYPDKEPFAEKVEDFKETYSDNDKLYNLITRISEFESEGDTGK